MPRFARIVYPGGIYHIISRICNREFLIAGKTERTYYLELVASAVQKSDALILAWCIMSSHVHLVVKAGNEPLERLMKGINTGFAMWINRQSGGRKGAVFADRYKSVLVDEENYLKELIRYVHNNPVRAKVVGSAKQSRWSSHRAYLGLAEAPAWLNSRYVLSMFARYPKTARENFAKYVDEGKREGRRKDLSGEESKSATKLFRQAMGDRWRINGPIVGSKRFQAKVIKDICAIDKQSASFGGHVPSIHGSRRPTLDELISVTGAVVGLEPWEFEQQPKRRKCVAAKQLIVWLWVRQFKGKQVDVAKKLNTSTAAVSRWYAHAVPKIVDSEELLDKILSKLPKRKRGRS